MDSTNFEGSLRAFQKRTPFRSFTVALVNGEQIVVDHPEALVLRGGIAVYVSSSGAPTLFDHESVSEFKGESIPTGA